MGDSRLEIESVLPFDDVNALLELCDYRITKYRHSIILKVMPGTLTCFKTKMMGSL